MAAPQVGSQSRVLLTDPLASSPTASSAFSAPESAFRAWRSIGWFGLVLALIGLADVAISLYPIGFGNVEWEFGTVAIIVSGYPLISLGFALMIGAAMARRRRRTVLALGVCSALVALLILGAFLVFLSDIPLVLRSIPDAGRLTMKKMIARTSVYSVGFFVAYAVAAATAIRYISPRTRR